MFKRILYDTWTAGIPVIAFCLTFCVFLLIVIQALRFKKPFIEEMSRLPLDSDETPVRTPKHCTHEI